VLFPESNKKRYYLSRSDVDHPLSSYSKLEFELDGAQWPSVEHYYQGMKFEEGELRESIRSADHPENAAKIAKANKGKVREDWAQIREVMMTRAVYIKCRTHESVTNALLAIDEQEIVESSQYDYFWGCGRDGRGQNAFGKVLMAVREKLKEE
jgi:hypothetical protein